MVHGSNLGKRSDAFTTVQVGVIGVDSGCYRVEKVVALLLSEEV